LSTNLDYCEVYPAEEYHEDYGPVLWWTFPVCEPAYIGFGIDDKPAHATHWSHIPVVWDGDGQALKVGSKK
jgi:hypothetical protein